MPNNLVISEAYVAGNGTASADYFEIYNPTSAAISGDGKSLQYKSATGAGTSGGPVSLAGLTIPAGGYVLVKGTGPADPTLAHDLTAGFNAQGSNAVLLLVNSTAALADVPKGDSSANTTIIDALGYGTGDVFEGVAETAPSGTVSMSRSASGADTNNNANDFTQGPPTLMGSTSTPPSGSLAATDPGAQTAAVGSQFSLQLAATGGTAPRTWTATGLPAKGLSISAGGLVSGTPTETGPINVTATVTDSATPAATDDTTFTITVAPAASVTPIAAIQGTGATSPLTGTVTTEGNVTASYPTGGLNGFYIQTPGADTPDASDAIFVYGGTTGFATYPAVGDSVRITGTVGEFQTATQITATSVTPIAALPGTVTPKTVIPGTDCALPGTSCLTLAQLDTAREVTEGELFLPTAPFTATDVYDFGPAYNDGSNGTVNRGEIALAANSAKPLVAPTEVIDAQATAARNERTAYNLAHRILLDDASSNTYSTTANSDKPFPWVTETYSTRVGAAVTFPAPVVFTQGFNGSWRLLPTSQVVGPPSATQPQFEQTRATNLAPQDVGGDVKLATFNVLNFFPTTGEEFDAGPGSCTFFTDRAGNRISNNNCSPNGPRGAANDANLARQRDKIVAAITTSGADVVSLEELENSVKFGKPRDFAIDALVTALNAGAPGTWAAVPSPAASELPPVDEQDVIRNGFIYKPANVALVGASDVLEDESTGTEAFADAREPVAQAFKKVGTPDADAFGVIVNHFKSKGSGTPDPDGQGDANDRRILQANSLVTFADEFKAARGISRIFLAGDFNAYSEEDPIQVLRAAGYANLDSTSNPDEKTYNFDGQVGSLDHVLANAAAQADVNAVDIWEINGNESVFYEYARFNTNVTNLYAADPFRSSDHSPEIVGINVAAAEPATREIQILATNDFHGRLLNNQAGAPGSTTGTPVGPNTSADTQAGAAVLSGAVKQLRNENPDTVFAAAGDLIGASTFESFIQNDNPTIDALNAAGLEVSAAGNHEFDAGYEDLVGRVKDRASWEYIAANVVEPNGRNDLADTWGKTFGDVQVGFVGAVTEDLPSLVSPAGIQGVTVNDIVDSTNAAAATLKQNGADLIILLVHEGAPSTSCASMTDPSTTWGNIVVNTSADIDGIVSGHTHLAYNCSFPVPGKSVERPVVSAGQYGTNLNQLKFVVDTQTGAVQSKTQALLPLKNTATPFAPLYPADPEVTPIVADAITQAATLGAVEVGRVTAPFSRAKFGDGTRENRGGESTLGNLVAEIQRWATRNSESGSAQIALMNPGGLRGDLAGTADGTSRKITYRDAANVQPFANTLVNMRLTGAQIETVLEQQWQTTSAGAVPTRPFLKLGQSDGFEYTYYTYTTPRTDNPTLTRTAGEVTSMKLDGVELVPTETYSVTVNSFLASGGDNFRELNNGTNKRDTGKADLQAQVDYFEQVVVDTPLAPDFSQRAVGVTFPDNDSTVQAGDVLSFDLSSLIMTGSVSGVADLKDAEVAVSLDGTPLGTFQVDQTIPNPGTETGQADGASTDESGKASVTVTIPTSTPAGARELTVTGATTGTEVAVPITVTAAPAVATTVTGTAADVEYGKVGNVAVTVTPASGEAKPTGTVQLLDGDDVLGTGTLADGTTTIAIPALALTVGDHTLALSYSGDTTFEPSTGTVEVTVVKQTPLMGANAAPDRVEVQKNANRITVAVRAAGYVPTGTVQVKLGATVVDTAELDALGNAVFTVGPYPITGFYPISVDYLGDANTEAIATSVTVQVVKQAPVIRIGAPATVKKNARPTVTVVVSATRVAPTGQVRFQYNGTTVTRSLVNGKVKLQLAKLPRTTTVRATYLGNANLATATKTVTIRVTS